MNHKVNFLLLVFMAFASSVMAQPTGELENNTDKRFYIKAYGGYGAFTPGSYRVETRATYPYTAGYTTTTPSTPIMRDTTIVSLGKKGMGQGARFGGGVGYIINNFLNVGVDLEYLKGNTLKATKSNKRYPNDGFSTLDYNVLTVNPHVLFKAKSSPTYYIYNRLGILLSLPFDLNYKSYDSSASQSQSTFSSTAPPPPSTTTSTYNSKSIRTASGQYKVPLSFGLNVALGAQFKIAGNLRGFAEAFANFTVLTPSTYTETSSTVSTSNTNTLVKNTSTGATISNNTTVRITTSNTTLNYDYQKEGGVSYTSTPGVSSTPPPVVTGSTTTYNYQYNYSYKQTLSNINRNMNAIGLNVGVAYRF